MRRACSQPGESTDRNDLPAQVLGGKPGGIDLATDTAEIDSIVKVEGSRLVRARSRVRRTHKCIAWARWLIAGFSDSAGDARSAEIELRAAIASLPKNEGIPTAP